jgi:hypothetical protein
MQMREKRIFISFAVEDKYARDHLVGQSNNINSSFDFVNMSVKEPWSDSWKTRCRTRIKGCDGVIALLSKKTRQADGARWEMKCAIEEGVPIIGMHVHKNDKGAVPTELQGKKVMNWTWNGISNFINSL